MISTQKSTEPEKSEVELAIEKAEELIANSPESKAAEEKILNYLIRHRKSVLLSGRAGTGKTTLIASVIAKLRKHLEAEGKEWLRVEATALTGLAGSLIPCIGGGSTVHSSLGIKIYKTRDEMEDNLSASARGALKKIGFLIIDEVSMLSASMITEIDAYLRSIKDYDAFMGGIPTLFSGDFMQLPPISKEEEKEMYAFQADVFLQNVLPHTVYLTTTHRQQDGGDFVRVLQNVRLCRMDKWTCDQLLARDISKHKETIEKSKVKPTKLYSTNRNVDRENELELEKLPGAEVVFTATHHLGELSKREKNVVLWEKVEDGSQECTKIKTEFDKTTLIPDVLKLKVGAQVIHLKNCPASGLRNGSRGVVTEFSKDGFPIIEFVGFPPIELRPTMTDRSNSAPGSRDKKYRGRKQIPIKLAWALTIHKSQGMTLDMAIVYFPDAFTAAQIYVALSRLKTIEGLFIIGFDPRKVITDNRVLSFYAKFDPEIADICKERGIEGYPTFVGAPYVRKPGRKQKEKKKFEPRKPTKHGRSDENFESLASAGFVPNDSGKKKKY